MCVCAWHTMRTRFKCGSQRVALPSVASPATPYPLLLCSDYHYIIFNIYRLSRLLEKCRTKPTPLWPYSLTISQKVDRNIINYYCVGFEWSRMFDTFKGWRVLMVVNIFWNFKNRKQFVKKNWVAFWNVD